MTQLNTAFLSAVISGELCFLGWILLQAFNYPPSNSEAPFHVETERSSLPLRFRGGSGIGNDTPLIVESNMAALFSSVKERRAALHY